MGEAPLKRAESMIGQLGITIACVPVRSGVEARSCLILEIRRDMDASPGEHNVLSRGQTR